MCCSKEKEIVAASNSKAIIANSKVRVPNTSNNIRISREYGVSLAALFTIIKVKIVAAAAHQTIVAAAAHQPVQVTTKAVMNRSLGISNTMKRLHIEDCCHDQRFLGLILNQYYT